MKRGKYVNLTTKQWRNLGYVWKEDYARVEWWCPQDRRLYDLFGFADYILLVPARGIVAVQITGAGHAEHKRKILACPGAVKWLRCHGHIDLVSWSKRKVKRGGQQTVWVIRVETITLEDFK